jgi:hypothetical protein
LENDKPVNEQLERALKEQLYSKHASASGFMKEEKRICTGISTGHG